MKNYLKTLISEKGRDLEEILEVKGASGMNFIPLAVLVDAIEAAPKHEQQGIKTMIVKIDFANGDVFDYFKHLAQAIAI